MANIINYVEKDTSIFRKIEPISPSGRKRCSYINMTDFSATLPIVLESHSSHQKAFASTLHFIMISSHTLSLSHTIKLVVYTAVDCIFFKHQTELV